MTDKTKTIVAWLNGQECCQAHGGPGCHPSRCGECPRDAADAIEKLQRDNVALNSRVSQQARTIAEMCQQAARYEAALRKIVAIEDRQFGGDWDEIAEARAIAYTAL